MTTRASKPPRRSSDAATDWRPDSRARPDARLDRTKNGLCREGRWAEAGALSASCDPARSIQPQIRPPPPPPPYEKTTTSPLPLFNNKGSQLFFSFLFGVPPPKLTVATLANWRRSMESSACQLRVSNGAGIGSQARVTHCARWSTGMAWEWNGCLAACLRTCASVVNHENAVHLCSPTESTSVPCRHLCPPIHPHAWHRILFTRH